MKKRILSMLLVCSLLLTILCVSVCAEEPVYVALGDSIAAGYGLEGFQAVGGEAGALVFTVPGGCYAELLTADLKYQLQNLAVSGDDTAMLLERMETAQYAEPLKQAELITLSIGSNDILKPVIRMVMEKYLNEIKDSSVLTTPGEGALLDGDVSAMLATLQSVNDYLNSEEVTSVLDAAMVTFGENWDTIIDTLHSWNPDAKLIVTNYYNPYYMMNLSLGTLNLSIGSLGQRYLDQMNAYISGNERNETIYHIADVAKTTTNVKLNYAELTAAMLGSQIDLSKAVNLDPHPDAAGHLYFAKQILAVLETLCKVIFPDMAGHWSEGEVSFVAGKGLVVGDAAGNFNPEASMTLGQYMTVLYRYAHAAAPEIIPEKATTGADWMEGAQYVNTEILGGIYQDLTSNMTRYQMADITAAVLKLLSSAAGQVLNTRETHGFTDVTENENVLFLESVFGIDGYKQNDGTYTFEGNNPIRRGEVAKVIYNIMTKSAA